MSRSAAVLFLMLAHATLAVHTSGAAEVLPTFDRLSPNTSYAGFRSLAVYLNDAERPMGARFVHLRTGFVLDILQIQSVPQGFIWVNSLPTSDQGEPHTQEHLLLGKGNMGRAVASQEPMSLANSSAFTMQWRTCYDFYTNAGPDVFYQQFGQRMDALLHPDYTDEEIRREVRNFGVTENPADKTLRLEEQGSVYNEMVNACDDPEFRVYQAVGISLYGKDHPVSYVSGGTPAGIRSMKPDDIRGFHKRNYVLDNMGMIAAVPKEMPLAQVLERTSSILDRLEPGAVAESRTEATRPSFPPPASAPRGHAEIADYPDANPQKPGIVLLAWAPVRRLDTQSHTLLRLFLEAVAGDATTNLYKRFVDSKTRVADYGIQSVSASVSSDPGYPVMISINEVSSEHLKEEDVTEIRRHVMDELASMAAWKNGSPELKEFNARIRSRLVAMRRRTSKFINSPPGFGFRSTGPDWMEHLLVLEGSGQFRRSVTLKPELAAIDRQLAGASNIWTKALTDWKLLDVPYAAASRPNPALITQATDERRARIAAEVKRLRTRYGVKTDQQAIRRYKADYDAGAAEIEAAARQVRPPRLVDALPLTLDDPLEFRQSTLSGKVPYVTATFDNMTSATAGLAFRLNGIPENQLLYVPLLPALLTEVGVVENGQHISYEAMRERLRNEILSLGATFSVNDRSGRYELVVRGAGNDVRESERAIAWMRSVLLHPDWSASNLPRIRDRVDQKLSGLRNMRQGYAENWVSGVGESYRRQDHPLFLATGSFLTQIHSVMRLRWQLMDGGTPADRDAGARFLTSLAQVKAPRSELKQLAVALQGDPTALKSVTPAVSSLAREFEALPPGAKRIGVEAAKDLAQTLEDLPNESLADDWSDLCAEMRLDLLMGQEQALASLEVVRKEVLRAGNARVFVIGSAASQGRLAKPLQETLASLGAGASAPVAYSERPLVMSRLGERAPQAKAPMFVGLLHPNAQGGVFMNSAPFVRYSDTDSESLMRLLAFNLYGGGGAHSIFMKTWGAGLAYGNGIGANPDNGRGSYYADQTPELPQTLRFVIDQLRAARPDSTLVEYAIALAFRSRAASAYEARGEAMAADLADAKPPDVVKAFRKAILELRSREGLTAALFERMPKVCARVLPGFGVRAADVPGAVYFVIGAEKQFSAYEAYLKSVEGPSTRLHRLYARDFWAPAPEVAAARAARPESSLR